MSLCIALRAACTLHTRFSRVTRGLTSAPAGQLAPAVLPAVDGQGITGIMTCLRSLVGGAERWLQQSFLKVGIELVTTWRRVPDLAVDEPLERGLLLPVRVIQPHRLSAVRQADAVLACHLPLSRLAVVRCPGYPAGSPVGDITDGVTRSGRIR